MQHWDCYLLAPTHDENRWTCFIYVAAAVVAEQQLAPQRLRPVLLPQLSRHSVVAAEDLQT